MLLVGASASITWHIHGECMLLSTFDIHVVPKVCIVMEL